MVGVDLAPWVLDLVWFLDTLDNRRLPSQHRSLGIKHTPAMVESRVQTSVLTTLVTQLNIFLIFLHVCLGGGMGGGGLVLVTFLRGFGPP